MAPLSPHLVVFHVVADITFSRGPPVAFPALILPIHAVPGLLRSATSSAARCCSALLSATSAPPPPFFVYYGREARDSFLPLTTHPPERHHNFSSRAQFALFPPPRPRLSFFRFDCQLVCPFSPSDLAPWRFNSQTPQSINLAPPNFRPTENEPRAAIDPAWRHRIEPDDLPASPAFLSWTCH
ncbi:hypothetical protein EV126DRAFT_170456 [Verticillium dahliae]|nr:hypothetical protein EV126DRAFT_170456 [Verticillium dahliae]